MLLLTPDFLLEKQNIPGNCLIGGDVGSNSDTSLLLRSMGETLSMHSIAFSAPRTNGINLILLIKSRQVIHIEY